MNRIIVAAPPIYGETMPLVQIAQSLAERGHDVIVLAGSRFEHAVTSSGVAFRPLVGAADYDDRSLGEIFPERSRLSAGPEQLNFDWCRLFADPLPTQHAILQELLSEDAGQCLVANSLFLGAWPSALGAPGLRPRRWLGVGANPVALSSRDTTFFGPVAVPSGHDQHAANHRANHAFDEAMRPTQRTPAESAEQAGHHWAAAHFYRCRLHAAGCVRGSDSAGV